MAPLLDALNQSGPFAQMLGPLRLRTLVVLRWLAVIGQTTAILVVNYGFGFPLPLGLCLAAIAASAWLNIFLTIRFPFQRALGEAEAAGYLAYDILQLTALFALTGGVENPFALLYLAPVTISASVLTLRSTVGLAALTVLCVSAMAVVHLPLPWRPEEAFALPREYVFGVWAALVLGVGFTGGYAWRIASERARMSQALTATNLALAHEQRLSALGGLAAAAAHELGTPLATIQLTASEMAADLAEDEAAYEDARLLVSQAQRCREILRRLTAHGDEGDEVHNRLTLSGLLEEASDSYQDIGPCITPLLEPKTPGDAPPELKRRPEMIYGLRNIIENATEFAVAQVTVAARWDSENLEITVEDDGPGFSPDIMARLGEPYVTTRPHPRTYENQTARDEAARTGRHEGLGLGFFISKTLLERTGARVTFRNRETSDGETAGAAVRVGWPRSRIEAPVKGEQ